ncbi:MAG: tRNA 2-selenouridine(34) synthase MnmH [Sphingomonadales bacterium]
MANTIKANQYPYPGYVLIDVRSEAEFERGHIPGAVNIPLLRNEERVQVGTTYKQKGREAAVALGFELLGPRFHLLYESFKSAGDNPLFYCWRGGLRSQISATLLAWGGQYVSLIYGGYKSYRHTVQQALSRPRKMLLLGGMTGVGKTEILNILAQKGLPVLDLEGVASHKGSALGGLGMPNQPSVEMYENLLHNAVSAIHDDQILILESESRKIGTCVMPQVFWQNMLQSPVIEIEVPNQQRLERLEREYAQFDPEVLAEKTEKLRKRLGGLQCQQAKAAILEGRKTEWVQIMMGYYDKSYRYFMDENGYKPEVLIWDWQQTENSLALLMNRLKEYGIEK